MPLLDQWCDHSQRLRAANLRTISPLVRALLLLSALVWLCFEARQGMQRRSEARSGDRGSAVAIPCLGGRRRARGRLREQVASVGDYRERDDGRIDRPRRVVVRDRVACVELPHPRSLLHVHGADEPRPAGHRGRSVPGDQTPRLRGAHHRHHRHRLRHQQLGLACGADERDHDGPRLPHQSWKSVLCREISVGRYQRYAAGRKRLVPFVW